MLRDWPRKPRANQQVCNPFLGRALSRVVTDSAELEDLPHHRASEASSTCEVVCDRVQPPKRHHLAAERFVNGAFYGPR